MSTPAQDEVDRLFSQTNSLSIHPEDRDATSDSSERQSLDSASRNRLQDSDSSDEDSKPRGRATQPSKMASAAYHLPTTLFDANTGPKGVIADAQSFDRAKKRSFRRTLLAFSNTAANLGRSRNDNLAVKEVNSSSDNSDDEDFMRQWRENRMQELQSINQQRRSSPSKRRYGTFDDVDANGYLDAVEKVPNETIVVVCIYDPESNSSGEVEDALLELSRIHMSTRFVKLHHEIAEMDHVGTPAILAYKRGDVFATLVEIRNQIPSGQTLNASNLEDLMRRHKILF